MSKLGKFFKDVAYTPLGAQFIGGKDPKDNLRGFRDENLKLFGLDPPELPGAPTTPNSEDPRVAAAAEEERKKNLRGWASTLRTGPQGLLESPTLASRTLYGGG